MTRRRSDFERLGDLMEGDGVLGYRETVGGEAAPARRISQVWAAAVGSDIADNTEPLRLVRGRLVVACSSSTWAQTLQLMAGQMCSKLNAVLEGEVVEDIVFRHAGWTRAGDPRARSGTGTEGSQAGADRELSDEQRQALAEVGRLGLAPVIKERLLAAMRESFARREREGGR